MSRADWSFLEHLLEEGQEHSTRVGRVWLTVLLLFRMLVLALAAESAWDDEQCNFVCNTQQPGCASVCYDRAFPISHFRYFVLQVIFVSTPSVFYFGYVAVRAGQGQSEGEGEGEREGEEGEEVKEGEGGEHRRGRSRVSEAAASSSSSSGASSSSSGAGAAARGGKVLEVIREEGGGGGEGAAGRGGAGRAAAAAAAEEASAASSSDSPRLKGRLLGAYAASVSVTVLLEAGFMAGLWALYDGFVVAARYECVGPPCPHTVDCFVSRPTEKTIFTVYTQAIAGLSLLLNLAELLHLLQLAVSQRLEKRYRRPAPQSSSSSSPRQQQQQQPGGDGGPITLPVQEAPSYRAAAAAAAAVVVPGEGHPEPPRGYAVMVDTRRRSEVNWGAGGGGGDGESDIPPSYLNCLGGMRSTHSPRAHVKKHIHGKHRKDNHKGPSKLKHYV